MTALVLDTRALEVIADPKADARAAGRMTGPMKTAALNRIPARVPTAVLAESYCGKPSDAAIDRRINNGVRVITTGKAATTMAGGLKESH